MNDEIALETKCIKYQGELPLCKCGGRYVPIIRIIYRSNDSHKGVIEGYKLMWRCSHCVRALAQYISNPDKIN